jgi:guanyl-specific ribonuclease Sa
LPSGQCDAEVEDINDLPECLWSQQPQLPSLGGDSEGTVGGAGTKTIPLIEGETIVQQSEQTANVAVNLNAQQWLDIIEYVKKNNGTARPGYKGGKNFINDGRVGGQILPLAEATGAPITYREYDVTPYKKGVSRGEERIVIGSNGTAYYTDDHYTSFTKLT